jgi:hypothetical protein
MEYYFNKENYVMAIEMGMKILRKRSILRQLDKESTKRICVKLDNPMTALVEKEIVAANREWNAFKTFFFINRSNPGGIDSIFERVRFFLGQNFLEELNSWKHYNEFVQNRKPYIAQTGYLENDFNPPDGLLDNFNYLGGFALDSRLRSIGINLGSKKPVAAIRLRRGTKETRVKPENLSLWISDDNKLYRRYTAKITFSNEARAMTLDHLDIVCQFLKIHCTFNDDKYTFAENFKTMLEIYGPPAFN